MSKVNINFSNYKEKELVEIYFNLIKEFKTKGMIRTRNIVGDLGEYIAREYYNSKRNLPDLQLIEISKENVDAIDNENKKYSIKTITTKCTGSFRGIEKENKLFDYVIIVMLNKDYTLNKIIEITWETFIDFKKWNKRNKADYLTITRKLLECAKVIYENK